MKYSRKPHNRNIKNYSVVSSEYRNLYLPNHEKVIILGEIRGVILQKWRLQDFIKQPN